MRRAEETRACHFHTLSPVCTHLQRWLSHTAEMIGTPPANFDVPHALWPVNSTVHQIALCLDRRKRLQICMATSKPGWAAWACRCLKHQAGRRLQPTRMTTAPAAFSYKPTRAKLVPLTGALFLWISSFKGTGVIPPHVYFLYINSRG